jgi:hypothetical protein
LYGFVGNDAVTWFDVFGTERKKASFNIIHKRGATILDGKRGLRDLRPGDNFDDPDETPDSVPVTTIEEIVAKLKEMVHPYKPDGVDPCHCIKHLIIWTHGTDGKISFGYDDVVSNATLSLGKKKDEFLDKGNKSADLLEAVAVI